MIIGTIVTVAIAMVIFFAVDSFQGREFNLVDKIIQMVVVLLVVGLSGWLTGKVVKQEPHPKVAV